MFNSQYYTCEQVDQRLLQNYLDDYNSNNSTHLTKGEFLSALYNFLNYGLRNSDIAQETGNASNKIISQKVVTELFQTVFDKIGEGYLFIGIVTPSTNPGSHSTPVFAFANTRGIYTHFLDSNGDPLTINSEEGLYIFSYDIDNENHGSWSMVYLYRTERVFDGGRADTVYGGSRNINCGGANN